MQHRFLIPASEADRAWLAWWQHVVPVPGRILGLSMFGDWFLVQDDDKVWRVDVLEGSFAPLGVTEAEFWLRLDTEVAEDEWLQVGHVVSLEERGLVRQRGQCYTYRLMPRLGGPITVDNMTLGELGGWQLFVAQVHQQLDHVPDGARITRLESNADGQVVVRWEES